MTESISHKRAKGKAPGQKEVRISHGRRLDSASAKTATEVERNPQNLGKAARRLKSSHRSRKILQVPQNLMDDATKAMRRNKVKGTVKNISGTKRRSVK